MSPYCVILHLVVLSAAVRIAQPAGTGLGQSVHRKGKPKGMEGRVVGGVVPRLNQFPYLIAIKSWMSQSIICGGSLINESLVLTAAHCVLEFGTQQMKNTGSMILAGGEHNLDESEEGGLEQYVRVKRVVLHKDYDPEHYLNDIAIVEVTRYSFNLTNGVQKITLATSRTKYHESNCTVAGWGHTQQVLAEDTFRSRTGEEIPRFVQLDIIGKEQCSKLGTQADKVTAGHPSTMCVGKLAGGKGSCNGDSGGPFACPSTSSGGEPILVGIVSAGEGCALPNSPTFYTNVSYMEPWIKKARAALVDGTKDAGGLIRI